MRKPAAAAVKRPAAAMKGKEPTWQLINHLGQTWSEYVDHLKEEYKDYKAREESFKTRDPVSGRLDNVLEAQYFRSVSPLACRFFSWQAHHFVTWRRCFFVESQKSHFLSFVQIYAL